MFRQMNTYYENVNEHKQQAIHFMDKKKFKTKNVQN